MIGQLYETEIRIYFKVIREIHQYSEAIYNLQGGGNTQASGWAKKRKNSALKIVCTSSSKATINT